MKHSLSVIILLLAGLAGSFFFTGTEGPLFFVVSGLLWLSLLLALVVFRHHLHVPRSPLVLALTLCFAIFLSTLFWTPVPAFTQVTLWRQSSLLVVFFTLVICARRDNWDLLRLVLISFGLILAVTAVGQYVGQSVPRATFLNKNSLAGFLLPLLFWAFLPSQKNWQRFLSFITLFAAGLALGLIGSRGALLAFGLGLCVLILASLRARIDLRFWSKSVGCVLGGVATSLLFTGLQSAAGAGRLLSLSDPAAAGAARILIWESSYEMLKTAPWSGIGVGVYGWLYPQYRAFADSSAGYFAHNDLLQVWIEAGIGGLLAALLAIGIFYRAIWRATGMQTNSDQRQELVALAGGLSALLVHSMFTFNAYVFSTLIVVGILLARAQLLSAESQRQPAAAVAEPKNHLWMVTALLCLFPLTFILLGGCSQYYTLQAQAAYRDGQIPRAFACLAKARSLWPSNDFNWYMEGEIVRAGLTEGLDMTDSERDDLLRYGMENLLKAQKLNPFRPMIPEKLAQLKAYDTDGKVTKNLPAATELFLQAVKLDPRYLPARLELAQQLEKSGARKQAWTTLEEGLRYSYHAVPALLPLLEKTAAYRREAGDFAGAQLLINRSLKIRADWK